MSKLWKTYFVFLIIIFFCVGSIMFISIQEVQNKNVISSQETLYKLASNKMLDLQTTDYWSHNNSDGCDFNCRVDRISNNHNLVSENLYKGSTCDIRFAIKLWENSPSHNAILNSNYKNAVILISPSKEGCYIVMDVSQ